MLSSTHALMYSLRDETKKWRMDWYLKEIKQETVLILPANLTDVWWMQDVEV